MLEFQIPIHFEDISLVSNDKYSIKNKINIEQQNDNFILTTIDTINERIKKESSDIVSHSCFDLLYSLLLNIDQLKVDYRNQIIKILKIGIENLSTKIKKDFNEINENSNNKNKNNGDDDDEGEDEELLNYKSKCLLYRNSIKMYIYFIERYISFQLKNINTTTNGGSSRAITTTTTNQDSEDDEIVKSKSKRKTTTNKKSTKSITNIIEIWEKDEEKIIILQNIQNLLELNLSQIWRLDYPEEEFINLISKIVYGVFEKQYQTLRNKTIKNLIFQILTTLNLKYNHSFTFTSKIINLLHSNEHLSTHCADLYKFIQNYYKRQQLNEKLQQKKELKQQSNNSSKNQKSITFLISDIIREIGKQKDKRDTSGFKNLAKFLTELTERLPKSVLPFVSLLIAHLDNESYLMRNAVTESIGYLIGKALNSEKFEKPQDTNQDDQDQHDNDEDDSDNSDNDDEGLDESEKKLKKEEDRKKKENDRLDLLNILFDRVRDVNGYCRSSVLKTLSLLVVNNWVPRIQFLDLTKIAIERLSDKNVQVRKRAVLLLLHLVDYNPYNDSLSIELFSEKRLKLNNFINFSKLLLKKQKDKERYQQQQQQGNTTTIDNGIILSQQLEDDDDNDQQDSKENKENINNEDEEIDENLIFSNIKLNREQFFELIFRLKPFSSIREFQIFKLPFILQHLDKYLDHAVKFIKMINQAMDTIYHLMNSTSTFDIIESIHFIEVAHKFRIDKSKEAINKMLLLIWSKEATIKEESIKSFYELFINEPKSRQQTENISFQKINFIIAKNLIEQTKNSTLGEMTSLEELIIEFRKKQYLDQDVIKTLWEIFQFKNLALIEQKFSLKFNKQDRRGALIILSMAANVDPNSILKNKIELLIQLGLENKDDDYLPRYTCILLQKLRIQSKSSRQSSDIQQQVPRFKNSLELFDKLIEYILKPLDQTDESYHQENNNKWYMFTEQAINSIYNLAEQPDLLASEIIKNYGKQINGNLLKQNNEVSSLILSRFIFILGQVAIKQLVYIEEIQSEKKRIKYQESINNKLINDKSSIEKELGNEQEEFENELELLHQKAESDILNENNLIGRYKGLVISICSNINNLFKNESLQICAVLTLSKFMCIDSQFCEDNLQLLFTLLETCETEVIRSNVIIGLGDLAFRFPNLVEPWTFKIYQRLRDPNPNARKNSLMVLTHLILNDMIKVKGQISEIALCLEDTDPRISNIAKLFFTTLSSKGSNLYNSLPDIIGKLSNSSNIQQSQQQQQQPSPSQSPSQQQQKQPQPLTPSTISQNQLNQLPIQKESIKNILKYLISFIEKDKQNELLIEKLILRFKLAKTIFEPQILSFCLQLLTFNEKSLRKLLEHYKIYQDKLYDDEVYNNILQCLIKTKKHQNFSKTNEIKLLIEELENKINSTRTGIENGENDNGEIMEDIENQQNNIPKPTPLKPSKKGPAKKKPAAKSSTTSKTPVKRNNKKINSNTSSESDQQSSDENIDKMDISDDNKKKIKPPQSTPRMQTRQIKTPIRSNVKNKKIESSSDEEEFSSNSSSSNSGSDSESNSESNSDEEIIKKPPSKKIIKKQPSKKQQPHSRLKKMKQSSESESSEISDSFDSD